MIEIYGYQISMIKNDRILSVGVDVGGWVHVCVSEKKRTGSFLMNGIHVERIIEEVVGGRDGTRHWSSPVLRYSFR